MRHLKYAKTKKRSLQMYNQVANLSNCEDRSCPKSRGGNAPFVDQYRDDYRIDNVVGRTVSDSRDIVR